MSSGELGIDCVEYNYKHRDIVQYGVTDRAISLESGRFKASWDEGIVK
jgi:hypothetical protein